MNKNDGIKCTLHTQRTPNTKLQVKRAQNLQLNLNNSALQTK